MLVRAHNRGCNAGANAPHGACGFPARVPARRRAWPRLGPEAARRRDDRREAEHRTRTPSPGRAGLRVSGMGGPMRTPVAHRKAGTSGGARGARAYGSSSDRKRQARDRMQAPCDAIGSSVSSRRTLFAVVVSARTRTSRSLRPCRHGLSDLVVGTKPRRGGRSTQSRRYPGAVTVANEWFAPDRSDPI